MRLELYWANVRPTACGQTWFDKLLCACVSLKPKACVSKAWKVRANFTFFKTRLLPRGSSWPAVLEASLHDAFSVLSKRFWCSCCVSVYLCVCAPVEKVAVCFEFNAHGVVRLTAFLFRNSQIASDADWSIGVAMMSGLKFEASTFLF